MPEIVTQGPAPYVPPPPMTAWQKILHAIGKHAYIALMCVGLAAATALAVVFWPFLQRWPWNLFERKPWRIVADETHHFEVQAQIDQYYAVQQHTQAVDHVKRQYAEKFQHLTERERAQARLYEDDPYTLASFLSQIKPRSSGPRP